MIDAFVDKLIPWIILIGLLLGLLGCTATMVPMGKDSQGRVYYGLALRWGVDLPWGEPEGGPRHE